MSCYWAKFEKIRNDVFRYDTRVYLNEIESPGENDICIGAVVGKNPGSALPSCLKETGIQKMSLDGDRLLPTIRSIFLKGYKNSNIAIEENVYIQVLNLMYICNKDLSQAIEKIEDYKDPRICDSEGKDFPFVWYLWGNDNIRLNQYKGRFHTLNTNVHFFLDTKTREVINRMPSPKDCARHTQGMKHELVIPYISDILKSMVSPT